MSQTIVLPRIGRLYKHYKGDTYKALLIGRDEETRADVVVYAAEPGGQVWVRPLAEFQPPRFVEVEPAINPYSVPSAKDARKIAQTKLYGQPRHPHE